MASNNKKKKKEFSFEEWSNANHGISKEQEEEDARKRQAYLAQQSADIAPVRNSGVNLSESALSDPNFRTYADLGAKVKNPSFEDATKGIGIAGWRPFADEIQNPVTYVRENEMEVRLLGNKPLDGIDFLWANMTDEEVEVYNYYLAKDGKDKAEKYLKSLERTLSEREGKKISNNINGNSVAEVIIGGLAGVESGVKGATVGMKNLITGSEETIAPSPMQYADRMMAEDNTGLMMAAHDTASAIGNMTPSLAVGILNPIAGAATMGLGVAGNKYDQMVEEGYDTDEARGSAIINGILEGGSQYLFGGISKLGGKGASAAFSKIAPKAAGKIAETIAKVAGKTPRILQTVGHASVEMGKEATEEALQTYLEPLVDSWVTGEEFEAPEFEEVVYSALLGAVTSGILEGAPAVGKATVDTITGKPNLTADEQTVVDRIAEYEIARREEKGETLSEKEKKQITEAVQRDVDKGYIPTEAIEAVLGGESYKTYRDTVQREDALRQEYEELGGLEKPTLAQQTRYQELHNSRDTFINDDMRNDLRSKAKDEVRKRVSGTRLEQSYLEADRKKEKFTADLSKYKDENERKTVENIVNSGLLDNTNKSHEIVDFLAKTSKDRKVTVEVTNNEKLKAEGKVYTFKKDITADGNTAVFSVGGRNIDKDFKPVVTVDGKAVTDFKVDYANGKITFSSPVAADSVIHVEYQKVAAMNGSYEKGKRVITFNVDSEEAIQTTIGHELKHSFEGTEFEDEFNKAIVDYAKKVGTYDSLVEAVKGVYNDGTEIDSEVTAILTGEYITTDEEFVKYLSTNHRNIFQRIYDEIKHWLKMVTAGSSEARALEKAKHIYAKMYRAEVNVDTDVKADGWESNFSIIGETKDGRRCYESGFGDDVSMDERIKLFKERIATIFNLGAVELKTDVKKIQVRGDKFTMKENLYGDKKGQSGEKEAKINALYDLADILATSKYDPSETNVEESYKDPSVKPKNPAHKGVKYWYKFKNEIVFDGVPYTVTFNIRDKGAEQYQYLIDFKENKTPDLSTTAVKSLLQADRMSLSDSIAPIPENVNTQMSNSSEDSGNQSTEEVKVLEGGTAVKHSLSTWTPETKDKVRKNLVKAGYEAERVDKWIDDLNGVASVIAADKDRLGFEAADNQVMLKNNQEYIKTLDASTLCAKRLQYQGTFDAIQHRLPNTVLTSDDLIELQNMLKEHGYEAPCSVCYVESRRRHLGKFAQEWLDGYEGEYKPHLDEVTTSDGLEKLRHSHPDTYKSFVDAMNAKGSANPKVVQLRTEYRNDIMSLTKKQVEKIEAIGGLRIQSFSDFETPHLLDMMQAVMDMSAKGLTSQAYTKVPNFAWVFGDTGIKINLSLIAEGNGFDSDGNLAFSSVEGMDINDAMAVRDAYSENVGTIIVGANDAHILACMADDRIDYIIPFHRSGWGKNEMEMMGLGSYEDYSYGQNEHDIATGKKVSNLYPPDYWDYNVSGKENAERYLKLCAQTGREPKFSNFLVNNGDGSYSLQPDGSTDGYWKTLIDFKMYDNEGNGAKQQKVQPNFNMEEAYRVLNEYEGGANSLPVAKDVVEEFVAKHSDDIAPTPDVQYSISPDTDADYMSAVERGDTETAQRMVDEAAKAAGYTRKLYHGTASKFNVFGFGRTGIFTTDNFDMAKTYGNNVMSLYGKEGAKVLHIDAKESPHWSIEVSKDVLDFSEYPLMRGKDRYSTNDISLIAFREGYDVVVIDNVYDNYSAASGNTENGLGTDVVYKDPNQVKSSEAITYDDNGNVIPLSQRFNEKSDDIRNSLSNGGYPIKGGGTWRTPARDLRYEEDIAPVAPTKATEAPSLADIPVLPDEPVAEEEPVKNMPPMPESDEEIIKTVKERLNAKITNSATELEETKLLRDWVKASYENKIEKLQTTLDSKKNKDTKVAIALRKRIANLKRVSADVDADIQKRISDIESRISKTAKRMEEPPKKDILEVRYERIDKQLEEDKIALKEDFDKRKVALWEATQDKTSYISNKALDLYNEVKSMRKGVRVSGELGYLLDNLDLSEEHKSESYKRLRQALIDIKNRPSQTVNQYSEIESIAREMLNSSYEDAVYDLDDMDNQYQEDVKRLEADAEAQKKAIREQAEALHRADVQRQKLEEVNSILHSKGFDLDEMLDNPDRQLSTFETVDTMPQRVMEKTFGYEAGQALADATVNKVAQNESAGLKWLDSITNRKNGLLAQLSKQYDIKPHSKEIAAAMMYGEGSWVNEETGEEFAYGDAELAKDFPDVKVQNNIKALVRDPRIRQFYDETLDAINEARKRNGYPEIPRRANYFLHYRELGDFFTKHGLPFNPNDARAKDLPTDMVGRTADLKPGQPFFTSSWQRKGKKTSYDLFEGMERYANSAKNQIYHIDDIQTLRALHYHLAERFGQAQGLENLNKLTPEQASERIKMVYGSHLSTFAAFLDKEANILAGKTAMMDRGISEDAIGRRFLTFMDALNQQTGATMVGYNVSSANTNWLPVVREFANSNPVDSVKALAQTVANIASRGKFDSFREDSTVYIRRQGADRFNRKLWQKMQDPAYAMMGVVDSISTEIIARTEYNKAIREGMNPQQAHYESDKKVSRLMADRSLGQMPQIYTSRLMGLVTKFQLEVRNDMDSMFYDTIQEEKLSHKDIENALERNAKTAARVAWRCCATAIALHAFGQAFEAVAGYNPAFDIIEAIVKTFGWDDDEDDEDTWRDNLGEGAMSLLEDLPYAGIVLDGGRIPISSALPDLKGIIEGKDEYGNDKSAIDHIKEIAPYMLPAGGNQLKKTVQGLKMFSGDHPVTGSYTDSGSLRFPVEKTPLNVAQAALFGQYASKNAREYFDNDHAPLKEKQIQEYIDVDMPIKDYWEYREGLNDIAPLPGKSSVTLEQKLDYVDGLDLPTRKKNILVNNLSSRKDPIDMTSYGDYGSLEEFDFATDKPEKYAFAKSVGGYSAYKTYSDALYDIKGDKDASGKTINGSRKEKVLDYINNLDADYYTKILLWKSEYPSDDSYDYEIVEYINNRSDLTYTDRVNALTELGFRVTADGQIYVD